MNLEEIKKNWQKKGLISEYYELKPQDYWSDPGHKTDEYFILLEGEMQVSCQDKVFNLEIGKEIMIPAQEPHIVKNNGSTVSKVLWIHYPNFA
ncbi:cupin domain-containing protein [Anabaena sp. FACHB-1237]|uniref:cupin domain-containing protein n=1 Tax=Anabaena sp. FACHB-1237 TaxID=2692769 RepID=UPI0016815201|nr:cupin domain-containing protein [Anabaena sp. FACHB-1237]MBD2139722.1 cupin domain-containing protein [Anabaena sp. FACHB-1237]